MGKPIGKICYYEVLKQPRCLHKDDQELDAGPLYMKRTLKLKGSALEIYLRASQLSLVMAKDIICNTLAPLNQEGEVVKFERLTYAENLIEEKKVGLDYFINMVRMCGRANISKRIYLIWRIKN